MLPRLYRLVQTYCKAFSRSDLAGWWRAAPCSHSWTTRSWLPRPGRTAPLHLPNKKCIECCSGFRWSPSHVIPHLVCHPLKQREIEWVRQIWFLLCLRTSELSTKTMSGGIQAPLHHHWPRLISLELNSSVRLTCGEARLFDLVRHLGVELFILLQIGPHGPPAATSLTPGSAPASCCLATSAPTLPLNQVRNSPLGHRRRLGDVFLYRGHQTWMWWAERWIDLDKEN